MDGDRLRIPAEDPYLNALGRAVYCFAYLEWAAMNCGEKLKFGFVQSSLMKTAGRVAFDLVDQVKAVPDSDSKIRLLRLSLDFQKLCGRRNDLVHAPPATGINGEQVLIRLGEPWTLDSINEVADEFAACSIGLLEFYHGAWLRSVTTTADHVT